MAKNMALVSDGVVINVLWCSDKAAQTNTLIDPAGRPVGIGDTYSDGKFYRDGAEVLTPLEAALAQIAALREEKADMQAALNILEVKPDEEVE